MPGLVQENILETGLPENNGFDLSGKSFRKAGDEGRGMRMLNLQTVF